MLIKARFALLGFTCLSVSAPSRAMAMQRPAEKLSMEKSALNTKLVETGEREKLKQYIQTQLSDCGWREELKKHCIEFIQAKGIEKVTIQEITSAIAPQARATLPEDLKTELFNRLRNFSEEHKLDAPCR